MEIDPRSHIPIYVQIADAIRQAVAAGAYRAGESLPSLRAMAVKTHVNPNTVQRAYDALAREGLIYARRGQGLFVAEQGKESAQQCAKQVVRRAFDDAIQRGRAAGLQDLHLRNIFERAVSGSVEGEENA